MGRDFNLLMVSSTASGIGLGLFYLLMPFYLLEAAYDATSIGMVGGLSGVSFTVFSLPLGMLADRIGKKRTTVLGTLLNALGLIMLASSTSFVSVAFSVVVAGLGSAATFASFGALLASSVEERMEEGFSIAAFVSAIAFSVGGGLGWLPEILSGVFPSKIFAFRIAIVLGSVGLLASIPALMLVRERAGQGRRRTRLKLLLNPRGTLSRFMLVNFFIGLGAGLTIPLFPVYFAKKHGVTSGEMGALAAVAGVVGALVYLLAPALARRVGLVRATIYTMGPSIPLLALIPLAPTVLAASPLFVARQALINMSTPLVETLLMMSIDESDRATAAGASQLMWNLPNSVSQPIGGYMMDRLWIDLPPYSTATFYAASTLLYYRLFRGVEAKRKPP